jgi:AcrR family transcriptional regulator
VDEPRRARRETRPPGGARPVEPPRAKRSRAPARPGGSSARRAPRIASLPRDEQADERRRQLVRVASELIERGGVDAVTLPEVTARAGCARTLAYRYFASREELLSAVIEDYFERLDERVPEAEQRAAVEAFVAAIARSERAPGRELVALFWDVQVAAGLGGAILRTTPFLSADVRRRVEAARRRFEGRITDPLCAAGLGEHEARIAVDSMVASFVALALRARAGEISRADAIDIQARATAGLIRGLLPTGSRRARRGVLPLS